MAEALSSQHYEAVNQALMQKCFQPNILTDEGKAFPWQSRVSFEPSAYKVPPTHFAPDQAQAPTFTNLTQWAVNGGQRRTINREGNNAT